MRMDWRTTEVSSHLNYPVLFLFVQYLNVKLFMKQLPSYINDTARKTKSPAVQHNKSVMELAEVAL